MYPDDKYRAFLLGTADAETEQKIEEEILDGRVDPDHIELIEQELIDDLLFGRLSNKEESSFRGGYLSTPRGAGNLAFARALQHYAAEHSPAVERSSPSIKLVVMGWRLASVAALVCAVLVAGWLGKRNLTLSHQLAQVTHANDEDQRVIASMIREQEGLTGHPASSVGPTVSKLDSDSSQEQAALQPAIRLFPGVSRGLATVPVLHLSRLASKASIVLELPFDPVSSLREELLNSENKSLWSQRFSITDGISNHGITTIVLPTGLLSTGEYRLRVESGVGDTATYLFRVHKD